MAKQAPTNPAALAESVQAGAEAPPSRVHADNVADAKGQVAIRPFTLNRDDGTSRDYARGEVIDPQDRDHWYVTGEKPPAADGGRDLDSILRSMEANRERGPQASLAQKLAEARALIAQHDGEGDRSAAKDAKDAKVAAKAAAKADADEQARVAAEADATALEEARLAARTPEQVEAERVAAEAAAAQ